MTVCSLKIYGTSARTEWVLTGVKGHVCNIFVIHKIHKCLAIFSMLSYIYWGRRCYGKTKCVSGILSGGCTSVTGTGDKHLPGICVFWRFVGSSVQGRNVSSLLYSVSVPTSQWVVEALVNLSICKKNPKNMAIV